MVGDDVANGFVSPDEFLVVLDLEAGTLGFATVQGRYLGVAFRGLRARKPLHLIISAVWGHCEVTMKYLGGRERKFSYTAEENSAFPTLNCYITVLLMYMLYCCLVCMLLQ
jgi:hypothetical protein